jgi:MYXO-CTERM domain-containing protein
MSLKFIRLAHELGLGVGNPKDIEVVGYDVSAEDWHFVQEDTLASKGQKAIYHGALKPFENALLRSPVVPWSYFASNFYHNVYWYPFVGRPRVKGALDTKWGRLFASYGDGKVVMPGVEPRTTAIAAGALGLLVAGGLLMWSRRRS